MDYSTDTEVDGGVLAMLLAFGAFFFVMGIVFYLFYGYVFGRIAQKAGKPLWVGFVPIYNLIVLIEVAGLPIWWIAVFIASYLAVFVVPFVGFLAPWAVFTYIGIMLARAFGKETAYGFFVGFPLTAWIMLPVLAFSDAQYQGPAAASESPFA